LGEDLAETQVLEQFPSDLVPPGRTSRVAKITRNCFKSVQSKGPIARTDAANARFVDKRNPLDSAFKPRR